MILSGNTSSPEVLCGRLEPVGSLEGMLTIPTIKIGGGGSANGVVVNESITFLFDGATMTYDLPANHAVLINVYVNGVYMTESVDYTIDRTSNPNKITFNQIYDEFDRCTIICLANREGGKTT